MVVYKPRSKKSWSGEFHFNAVRCSWFQKPLRLHHTVTNFKYMSKLYSKRVAQEKEHMRQLRSIAISRGYSELSYNYVVFPSGRFYVGRGERVVGAHTLHHNEDPGVALVGNFEIDKVNRFQKRGIKRLRRYLRKKFKARADLIPHCRTYGTACPGANARAAFGLTCH